MAAQKLQVESPWSNRRLSAFTVILALQSLIKVEPANYGGASPTL